MRRSLAPWLLLVVACAHVAKVPARHRRPLGVSADLRCKDGCRVPLAQVLPAQVLPTQVASGVLLGSRGEPFTVTRASSRFCGLTDGGLVSVGVNVPCVDPSGLNVEGAATNLALQSTTLATAPWSLVNSETATNAFAAAPDGTLTASKLSNGGVAFGLGWNSITVTSGGVYSMQFWAKGTASSTTLDFGWFDGAIFIAGTPKLIGPGTLTGFSPYHLTGLSTTQYSHVLIQGITNGTSLSAGPLFYADGQNSTSGGSDIIANVDVETGPICTSYVATTTATATRAADVVSSHLTLATIGDSITQGNYDAVTPWPTTLGTNLGAGFTVENDGVGGIGTATMLSSWQSTYSAEPLRVITVLGGTNDITTGGAEATILANLESIYMAALAQGEDVVVLTVPPCGGGTGCTTATPKAEVTQLNADIAAWRAAHPEHTVLVDANLLLRDPAAPNQYLAAYDRGDHIHPNQAGIDVLAAAVTTAVQKFGLSGRVHMRSARQWCVSADVVKEAFLASGADGMPVHLFATASDRFMLYLWSDGAVICEYYNGTTDFQASAVAGSVTAGTKAHLACRYDGSKLYASVGNTTVSAAAVGAALLSDAYTVYLGEYNTGLEPLYGSVSNVAIDTSVWGCP